jgi:hypothetical protein
MSFVNLVKDGSPGVPAEPVHLLQAGEHPVPADMATFYFRNIQYINNRSASFRSFHGSVNHNFINNLNKITKTADNNGRRTQCL